MASCGDFPPIDLSLRDLRTVDLAGCGKFVVVVGTQDSETRRIFLDVC